MSSNLPVKNRFTQSNQLLRPTADQQENLHMITSTMKFAGQLCEEQHPTCSGFDSVRRYHSCLPDPQTSQDSPSVPLFLWILMQGTVLPMQKSVQLLAQEFQI